jgi:cholesterol oxidase
MHDEPERRDAAATPHAERRDAAATPHPQRRSKPVESLLAEPPGKALACDVLVIGSGYGGSFAAAELAREGRSVWVLERGREYARGEFPETLGELPGHVQLTRGTDRAPRGRRDALFDLRIDEDVAVLTGCGLGGGSLVNAGVVIAPRPEVFDDPRWPAAIRTDRGAGLAAAFGHVRTVLGAAPLEPEKAAQFGKYRALRRLAGAIPGARVSPAPIAVSRLDGKNAVGVMQQACIDCGNCVTGCNHDAKNTLAMNAIPLAIARGAQFWTGARAIDVLPAGEDGAPVTGSGAPRRWRVRVARVATLGAHREQEVFEIHADTVVIAAGSLGSTELLLRSREAGLALSERLGSAFSGNGDQMAFGVGQGESVGAVARPVGEKHERWARVGPTIVGVVDRADGPLSGRSGGLPPDALVQEAAMPAALRPLLGTLMSTASFAHGAAHDAPHAFARRMGGGDPIAAPESLVDHCQVLLAMGADAAEGHLRLEPPVDGQAALGERRLRISADYARRDPKIAAIDAALAAASRPAQDGHDGPDGFDGGWYVPNPLWKPMPEGGERAFGELDGRSVTVHPLGGCPMGEDRHTGVTDADGAVFDASADDPRAVHAGLHVLDGAILPTSLGVNPMLTIAALAVRASVRIDARLPSQEAGAGAGPRAIKEVPPALQAAPFERARRPVPDAGTRLRFGEVLHTPAGAPVDPGALAGILDGLHRGRTAAAAASDRPSPPDGGAARPTGQDAAPAGQDPPPALSDALRAGRVGLVLQLDAQVRLAEWVAEPGTPWIGTAKLSVYDFGDGGAAPHATGFAGEPARPGGTIRDRDPLDVTATAAVLHPIGIGDCRLELLSADPPAGRLDAWRRRLSAFDRFCRTRPQDDWTRWPQRVARRLLRDPQDAPPDPGARRSPRRGGIASLRELWADIAAFRRVWRQHLLRRELRYSVTLRDVRIDGRPVTLELTGTKRLAYADEARDLWDALLGIDLVARVQVQGEAPTTAGPWRMQVDVLDLLRRGVYRIDDAPDTPTAIAAIAATGSLWVRALARSHFWSFPGPAYGVRVPVPSGFAPLSALVLADGLRIAPEAHRFVVDRRRGDPDRRTLALRVSRYRRAPGDTPRGALLLVHGLAHGGEVFVTPTTPRPLAARFVEEGWDVFVLDHRLSSHLRPTPEQSATIDDIAHNDIPGAFDAIDRVRGHAAPIRVIAHCVGAAALSMAVLAGRLTRGDGRSRISALVLHAVHPWVVPSAWNRVSASLAGFYQDFLGDTVLDPIPPERSTAVDQLVDRLAASLPWSEAEAARHRVDPWRPASEIGHAICNRMTLFYGREWLHANLTDATHDALHRLVGPAHVDVFRHIFFLALRHRLTDANGDNVYLRAEHVAAHWTFPTLFATGRENRVFDPSSAARSYQAMSVLRSDPDFARTGRVGLYLPPDVGHMDFLFGRFNHLPVDAAALPGSGGHGIQDTLAAFLDAPDAWLDRQEAGHDAPDSAWSLARRLSPRLGAGAAPWTGPLLRYERSADGTGIELQVWYELHPHRSHGPQSWRYGAAPARSPWTIEDLTSVHGDCAGTGFGLPGSYHLARMRWVSGLESGTRRGKWPAVVRKPGAIEGSGDTTLSIDLKITSLSGSSGSSVLSSLSGSSGTLDVSQIPQLALPVEAPSDDGPAAPADPADAGSKARRRHAESVDALRKDLIGRTLHVPIEGVEASPWARHLLELLAPAAHGRVRTMTFLLASCHWPGLAVERGAVDRTVNAMRARVAAAERDGGPPPIDALFLLGDQIYADAFADAFDTTVPAERAARRYRDAWSGDARLDEHHAGGAMAALLAQVPFWSVIDDHEFVDDWPGASAARPPDASFRRNFAAAVAYQWRRGQAPGAVPALADPPGDGPPRADRPRVGEHGVERGFWQPFEAATLRCFALDTRTERTLRTDANRHVATIMSAAQHEALAAWLASPPPGPDPTAPPLILCGSPIGLPRAEEAGMPGATMRADDWHAYPASCRALLRAILDAGIEDAVMLCGDPHYSCVVQVDVEDRGPDPSHETVPDGDAGATTTLAGGEPRRCRLHVIVASGLNASMPFANAHPRELVEVRTQLPFSGDGLCAWATATPLSSAPRQFTEFAVHLSPAARRLEVNVFDGSGARVATHTIRLAGLVSTGDDRSSASSNLSMIVGSGPQNWV